MAEAHCRARGRRLCAIDELQHWAQCFQARFGDNAPPLGLGCYQPLPTREEQPNFTGYYVICEFVAEMFPIRFGEPSDLRHGVIGMAERNAREQPIPDARGYARLRLYPNDDRTCGEKLTRCCLDL